MGFCGSIGRSRPHESLWNWSQKDSGGGMARPQFEKSHPICASRGLFTFISPNLCFWELLADGAKLLAKHSRTLGGGCIQGFSTLGPTVEIVWGYTMMKHPVPELKIFQRQTSTFMCIFVQEKSINSSDFFEFGIFKSKTQSAWQDFEPNIFGFSDLFEPPHCKQVYTE